MSNFDLGPALNALFVLAIIGIIAGIGGAISLAVYLFHHVHIGWIP